MQDGRFGGVRSGSRRATEGGGEGGYRWGTGGVQVGGGEGGSRALDVFADANKDGSGRAGCEKA